MTAPVLARPPRQPGGGGTHFRQNERHGGRPSLRDDLGLSATSAAAARSVESTASPDTDLGAPPQRPAHLKVVDRRRLFDFGHGRTRMAVTATVGLLLFVVFGLVGLHVKMEQNQLQLDQLQNRVAAETLTYQRLRVLVASLEAPARIVEVAEGRLGMISPPTLTYLSPASTSGASATSEAGTAPKAGTASKAGNATKPATDTPTVTAPAGSTDWPGIKAVLDANP